MEGNNNKVDNSNLDDSAVTNQTFVFTPSSSTSECVSGDDTSEGKSVIPASLVTAENYLTISEVWKPNSRSPLIILCSTYLFFTNHNEYM